MAHSQAVKILKRVYLCTLFFLTHSCTTPSHTWSSQKIETCSQATLSPQNFFSDLGICLQKDEDKTNIYLNAYCLPFNPDQDGTTNLFLLIDKKEYSFKASALAGNHRLLLPEEAKNLLLNALHGKKEIVISVGKYRTDVHSHMFSEAYKKFNDL